MLQCINTGFEYSIPLIDISIRYQNQKVHKFKIEIKIGKIFSVSIPESYYNEIYDTQLYR